MLILMAADIAAIQLCSFLALLIRFDLNIAKIPAEYSANVLSYGLIHCVRTAPAKPTWRILSPSNGRTATSTR